jgi:intergrase/recombinase
MSKDWTRKEVQARARLAEFQEALEETQGAWVSALRRSYDMTGKDDYQVAYRNFTSDIRTILLMATDRNPI